MPIHGLTVEEFFEFKKLGKKLFKGNSFVVFSDEERNSPEFKRYDELMLKKLKSLKKAQAA